MWKRIVAGRLLAPLLLLQTACGYDQSVRKEVLRGAPREVEAPSSRAEPYAVRSSSTVDAIVVEVLPTSCVTFRETPVTTTAVTDRTSRWTNSLPWIVGAAAWGALGALSWSEASHSPDRCDPTDKECATKSQRRGAAYFCWGMGAAFTGLGVWAGFPHTTSTRGQPAVTVERERSAEHPCAHGTESLPVELRLPGGKVARLHTDARGVVRFPLAAELLEGLGRSAFAQVLVAGVASDRVDLGSAVAAWQKL